MPVTHVLGVVSVKTWMAGTLRREDGASRVEPGHDEQDYVATHPCVGKQRVFESLPEMVALSFELLGYPTPPFP